MVAIGQMYSSPDWKKVLSAIEVGTQRLHSTDLSDFEGQEGPCIDLPGRFGELHLSISSACGMIKDHGRPWKTKFPPGETMEEPCVNRLPAMDLWSLGVSYGTWAVDVFGAAEVSFSRCGSKLLMALDSCDVKVVDATTGRVICRILGFAKWFFDVQW